MTEDTDRTGDERPPRLDRPPSVWKVDFDGVPDWVRMAIDRVLPDFQHPTEMSLRFGMTDNGRMLAIGETSGWSAFAIDRLESGEAFVAFLADYLQDQVLDQSEAAWGEARPMCPGHRHMLLAEEDDGCAWWSCPETGDRIVKIGEYSRLVDPDR